MNSHAAYLKLLYESGESLSERQWDKLYQKIRLEAIRDITMDELRENNPELYQEIAEDIMMSAFAGRADEVYSIVLPAINEMRKEIDDSMELLKRELSAIVDRNAKKKFAELLSEIEKATSYKNKWRQKELARMRAEEKQKNEAEKSTKNEAEKSTKNEAEKSSKNDSIPTNTRLTKWQSQAKRRSEKSDVEKKIRRKAAVGDFITRITNNTSGTVIYIERLGSGVEFVHYKAKDGKIFKVMNNPKLFRVIQSGRLKKNGENKETTKPTIKNTAEVHHEEIRIGDSVMYHDREVSVIDVINKYGIRKLIVKDQFGETFAITNYDI